jgi:hypothetical protein
MNLTSTQRKLSYALAQNGYVGNRYRTPNKVFLKVYLHNSDIEFHMRYVFSKKNKVMEYELSEFVFSNEIDHKKRLFDNANKAIKSVIPDAFAYL